MSHDKRCNQARNEIGNSYRIAESYPNEKTDVSFKNFNSNLHVGSLPHISTQKTINFNLKACIQCMKYYIKKCLESSAFVIT